MGVSAVVSGAFMLAAASHNPDGSRWLTLGAIFALCVGALLIATSVEPTWWLGSYNMFFGVYALILGASLLLLAVCLRSNMSRVEGG